MKKLLLISLIIGTALSQVDRERLRIAQLRRRQQLANLSEQELINGGFLSSGSPRVSDGFRGSEPSFDTFSSSRRRFRSNVVHQNVGSPVPRRRSYFQSLRTSLRRNGGRSDRTSRFFRRIDRPVDEQGLKRTYMPAIKRPSFTPNIQDILPRRRPSYSPTARGIDSIWTPRLPSTVSGAGNFLPSSVNDFIQRTNPVNDRSYISPKKPSLIVEPIPLPPLHDPDHISIEPIPSKTQKPGYVAPKNPVLPDVHKPDYVEPVDPVHPVAHKPGYVEPVDPVLPVAHKPGYVEPVDPVHPVAHKPGYVEPVDPVLPVAHKPGYVEPVDPVLPIAHKPGYVKPVDPVLPVGQKPGYVEPLDPVLPVGQKPGYVEPVDPVLPVAQKPGYVEPVDPVLPVGQKPGYVEPIDPVLPVGQKPGYSEPIDPVLPVVPDLPINPKVKDPNYVSDPVLNDPFGPLEPIGPDQLLSDPFGPLGPVGSDQLLTDPFGPLEPPVLPIDNSDPGYVDPTLPSDPIKAQVNPKLPPNVKDPNYVPDKVLSDPFDQSVPPVLPLDINDPGYVDPSLTSDPFGPLELPVKGKLPKVAKDPKYAADPLALEPSLNIPTLKAKDPNYATDKLPIDPTLDIPTLPLKDPNYVADKLPIDPTLDIPTLPLKDPNYVADKLPIDPTLGIPTLPLKDPNYVADKLPIDPTLDIPALPLNDPNYVADKLPIDPTLDIPILPSKDPNYAAAKQAVPSLDIPILPAKDPNYVADPLSIDPSLGINNLPLKDPNYVAGKQPGPINAPLDPFGMIDPTLPIPTTGLGDPNYVEPPVMGLVDPLNQPFDPTDPFTNPLGPLNPIGTLDSSAVLPTKKPGYVPPNDPTVDSVGPIDKPMADPFEAGFSDTLPIPADPLLQPLLPVGAAFGDPMGPLASSKLGDPNYVLPTDLQAPGIDNQPVVMATKPGYVEPATPNIPGAQSVPKVKVPKGSVPDSFGPLDLSQDPLSFGGGPIPQFPLDNVSPIDGSPVFPQDIPSLPGLIDPLNPDFGGNLGPTDPLLDPSNYPPEPALPHSPLFDNGIPALADIPNPLDPISNPVMTRSEINEAARREYAKGPGAFDPKWNNPNVRNSDLYVQAKPVAAKDVRPAKIKTLFDFTSGSPGADFMNKAVDKVSEKTKDIMTAKSKRREGYTSKYDALRSYEG